MLSFDYISLVIWRLVFKFGELNHPSPRDTQLKFEIDLSLLDRDPSKSLPVVQIGDS